VIQKSRCKSLVLDAGPLLSLSPLRGLADTYLTVPQVLSELRDSRAREHFERLGMMSGVNVIVRSPDPASLAHVIQWAKKTGDYAVLSHPDLCILALTYALHEEEKCAEKTKSAQPIQQSETEIKDPEPPAEAVREPVSELIEIFGNTAIEAEHNLLSDQPQSQEHRVDLEPLDVKIHSAVDGELFEQAGALELAPIRSSSRSSQTPIFEDPSDSDDGEGEWITPTNVALHKSRALDLLPDIGKKGKVEKDEVIGAGCMTADFAMQNVLLQMGLSLVSVEGKKIERVKSWVLRCHACFKICKDHSKKFCPSCGNPTLLRASVTIAAPNASADAPVMQVHLKANFQYKTRGTKYPIPAPKAGSAKTGPGEGLILREDQVQFIRAKKMADGKREREEARFMKGILGKGVQANGPSVGISSWMDPDWVPEMVSVGAGGRGRTVRNSKMDGDLPQIGYGRKNPNERKRHK